MTELTIYRRYFYNAKCYREAPTQEVKGVQVHSTWANNPYLRRYVQPDDGRLGQNPNGNSHNGNGTVCANAYIGKQADGTVAVYQTLPWDKRCWLSGSGDKGNANKLGYVGFEICEDNRENEEYYRDAMQCAAMLTAYLCQEYGLDPDKQVFDHAELSGMGLASGHKDIGHWLKLYGHTMQDFRAWANAFLAEGIRVTYIDCDDVTVLFQARVDSAGYLNLRSGKAKTYASIAQMVKGSVVDVLDCADPEWWRVAYIGKTGWAMSQYLSRLSLPESPQPPKDTAEPGSALLSAIETAKLQALEAHLTEALSIVRALERT